jgi:hypothetical protein
MKLRLMTLGCAMAVLTSYAHAGDKVVRPSKVRTFFANMHLRGLTKKMETARKYIATWHHKGKLDFRATGKVRNLDLSNVRDAIWVVGERLADQKALRALKDASSAVQKSFGNSLQALRNEMEKLDGVHFLGRTLDKMTVGHGKEFPGGIAGMNIFVAAAGLGKIRALAEPTRKVRLQVGDDLVHKKKSPEYRLRLANSYPQNPAKTGVAK